jgi:hypothetical protein
MAPETAGFALSATISSLGLLGLLVCRIGERSGRCSLCQLLFFLAMFLVAGATLVSLALHSDNWVFSGVTLATMAVGGTLHTGELRSTGAGEASVVGR